MGFISIMVQGDYGDEPYELLLRVEDIICFDSRSVTYQIDSDTIDSMLLAEKLEGVIARLVKAGVPVYRG